MSETMRNYVDLGLIYLLVPARNWEVSQPMLFFFCWLKTIESEPIIFNILHFWPYFSVQLLVVTYVGILQRAPISPIRRIDSGSICAKACKTFHLSRVN